MLRIILVLAAVTFGSDLDRQWKARALQGMERADSLLKLHHKKPAKKLQTQAKLELAFANFINADFKGILVKRSEKLLAYHIMLEMDGSEESHNLLDVVYLYDPKSEEFLGVRVDRLPKKWSLRPDLGEYKSVFAITNTYDMALPGFVFSKTDPFNPMVMD